MIRPKGVQSITERDVMAAGKSAGLVDVKVAAIDTDWSGLKVVWRKELRVRST
mgnify:CR=1 FL=1